MKLAIMQPYFFPYIGYFQLIHAVDKFVIYDDVDFIKGGWINRNRVLIGGKPSYFNVQIQGASSFKKINEITVNQQNIKWKKKLLRSIQQSYAKAPFAKQCLPVIEQCIQADSTNLSAYLHKNLALVCDYLDIKTEIVPSSAIYENQDLSSVHRVLDICKKENASVYINPIGGQALYNQEQFSPHNIQLHFIKTLAVEYPQFNDEFHPWLSIIDIMMFNDVETIKGFLTKYELV